MEKNAWPMWINGEAVWGDRGFHGVLDKYSGEPIAQIASGTEEHVHLALQCASRSLPQVQALSVEERAATGE